MFEQELLQIIKQAATGAVQAGRPADLAVGTVTSAEPLHIKLTQGLELEEAFLCLSRNVTDYEIEVTVTEDNAKKTIRVHNALKKGETALLFRKAGGQEYVVLDRVVK